jgi:regulator of sirC expression with transglutaminase-like and TPR domain
MNLSRANKPSVRLSDSQLAALIRLLGDEDPKVYRTVRSKFLSSGPRARNWLAPHLLSADPVLRRRAREISDYFSRKEADNEFLAFCLSQGEEFDVEQASFTLARTEFPNINVAGYAALLDSYTSDLRERLNLRGRPEPILGTINWFLFHELGFAGNEEHYYDPENSYVNRVLDRRTGNPVSLCLVYLMLAKRLRLPMTGIGLPGHFVCRYQSSTNELFIDAFNRGRFLTKADCVKYLVCTNHGLQEGHLAPMSPRRILLRVCANLHQIYSQLEDDQRTERFKRYLVALAK